MNLLVGLKRSFEGSQSEVAEISLRMNVE